LRLNAPCVCSSFATTDANSICNASLPIQLMLRISLTRYFSHSLKSFHLLESHE
jgi:hypothetical protein